jgi:hypothetical protein
LAWLFYSPDSNIIMSDNSNSNSNRIQQRQPQQQAPPPPLPPCCQQPLIQLLDGVLAQSERRVKIAVTEITRILLAHDGTVLQLQYPERSTVLSVTNLYSLLQTLLAVFPAYAKYPSQRDVSLPLHFAASIGNIEVASLLLSKVRIVLTVIA